MTSSCLFILSLNLEVKFDSFTDGKFFWELERWHTGSANEVHNKASSRKIDSRTNIVLSTLFIEIFNELNTFLVNYIKTVFLKIFLRYKKINLQIFFRNISLEYVLPTLMSITLPRTIFSWLQSSKEHFCDFDESFQIQN